jgi:hypothetical protein
VLSSYVLLIFGLCDPVIGSRDTVDAERLKSLFLIPASAWAGKNQGRLDHDILIACNHPENRFDMIRPEEVIYTKDWSMAIRYQKTVSQDDPEKEKKTAEPQSGDDACRCKKTSEMTPRELLKLMISDLAFWKKAKKD